ncbi:AhpC/TSA family protein [Pedobacter sp. KBS0701]|uniref:TlpA disulfide reductase family protein n=1 Tax=Pedobacter sp. KBS0701 TaxID=2578106 RepID=UPI00110D593F|nr:TlpA disulfide reductase family protein [Pedobacter sp. KBS0701]QDW26062.1 AhpC/TSA family protein [Pedobacter sp. KBS0701]
MMKRFLLITICLLPLSLLAQSSFTIKGFGKAYKNGDKIFLTYRQGDQLIEDSTLVNKGSFEFRGNFKTKVRGYICRNDNPRFASELFDSFDIYIEAGQITLNSPDTLNNSIISGTPLNNDYAKLHAALKSLKEKKIKDPGKLSAEELKDTALVNLIKAKAQTAYYETFPIQFSFVDKHPNSYVSLLTLSQIARTSKYLPRVAKSFAKLSIELKEMPEGKKIAKDILEGKKISIGMMAKDFIQNDINGNPVRLSTYQNKYVLVDFWASWCQPCREENPNVLAVYHQYKEKNFTVLSVSIDVLANKANWLNAIKEDQLPWMQVSDLKKENEAAKLYGVTSIPSNVLIDPSGRIIAKDIKGKELRDKMAELLGAK